MCSRCDEIQEIPEREWRLMVSGSLKDHLEMIEEDAELMDKRNAELRESMQVVVDTQCVQGVEVFSLKEELKSLRDLVRRVSEVLLDPTTDTTALASRLAIPSTAHTATTTGDRAPETSRRNGNV